MIKVLYSIIFTFILLMQYVPVSEINSYFSGSNLTMVEELNETNNTNNSLNEIKEPQYLHQINIPYFPPLVNIQLSKNYFILNETTLIQPFLTKLIKPPNNIIAIA